VRAKTLAPSETHPEKRVTKFNQPDNNPREWVDNNISDNSTEIINQHLNGAMMIFVEGKWQRCSPCNETTVRSETIHELKKRCAEIRP
jgi:hypothetical protein